MLRLVFRFKVCRQPLPVEFLMSNGVAEALGLGVRTPWIDFSA